MSVLSTLRRGAAAGAVMVVLAACGSDDGADIREIPGNETGTGTGSGTSTGTGTGTGSGTGSGTGTESGPDSGTGSGDGT